MTTLRRPYPAIEPFETGRLAVGDGHELYFEICGNPEGIPAVFLHGGPGSGASPQHRRLFDPERYRVLLFDQRGCGRSTPHGELEANTTWHLVADLERLRERWASSAGWCSAAPGAPRWRSPMPRPTRAGQRLVLRGVFTGRRAELDWFYDGGANRLFPDRWENLLGPIPAAEQDDLVAAYRRRLTDPDRAVRAEAARAWTSGNGDGDAAHDPVAPAAAARRHRTRRSPSPGSRTTISTTISGWKRAS